MYLNEESNVQNVDYSTESCSKKERKKTNTCWQQLLLHNMDIHKPILQCINISTTNLHCLSVTFTTSASFFSSGAFWHYIWKMNKTLTTFPETTFWEQTYEFYFISYTKMLACNTHSAVIQEAVI